MFNLSEPVTDEATLDAIQRRLEEADEAVQGPRWREKISRRVSMGVALLVQGSFMVGASACGERVLVLLGALFGSLVYLKLRPLCLAQAIGRKISRRDSPANSEHAHIP